MPFCSSCGTAPKENARFCANCGHPLEAGPHTTAPQRKNPTLPTLRSLRESGSLQCAQILENYLANILLAVGGSPLRSEDIGWASLSFISGSLSNNSSEVIVLLNCWDRRPGEGYPARLIRDSFIYRRGGAWSLR